MAAPYVISLAFRGTLPRHVQIAQAIADDIARGRLKSHERLPGSRKLAHMLGVHRNTVNAALNDLAAQGWVEAHPKRGVFVRAPKPSESPKPFARGVELRAIVPERTGFAFHEPVRTPVGKSLSRTHYILTGGVPDPRLFPGELLARAYRRVLKRRSDELLDYGDALGALKLRRALSELLTKTRGLAASPENVIITRGSQQALWLAARCLIAPGERIGVEALGYPPAWEAFRDAGATLMPLEVDHEGVVVASVERALSEGPLRALYLTPHHQYPTMVALSARRRLALLELARKKRFAILEDDYSHEFQYEGRPRLPMASADHTGQVVYVGALSKTLAPGLRIGYAVAPRALIERMGALRTFVDRQGDTIAETAVAELIEDGEVMRHVRRMRGIYEARRDVLVAALKRELGERVSFDVPQGGMALWVRVHGLTPERWVESADRRGVRFRAGSELCIDRRKLPYVRMGFTRLDERELKRAVRLAAEAFTDAAKG